MNIHELRHALENTWRNDYEEIVRVVHDHGLESGVTVGVAFGGLAEMILDNADVIELVGVDAYEHRPHADADPLNLPPEQLENLFWYAIGRLARFGSRYGHLRGTSAQVAQRLAVETDFVVLDASHAEVAEDLSLWYPKLRPGGVITGRGYGNLQSPHVQATVEAFAARHGTRAERAGGHVWWAKKPGG